MVILWKRKQLELCVFAVNISKCAWFPELRAGAKVVFLSIVPSYDHKTSIEVDVLGFGIVCVGTSARFQMHSTFENVLPLLVHREREQESLRSSSSYARAAYSSGRSPLAPQRARRLAPVLASKTIRVSYVCRLVLCLPRLWRHRWTYRMYVLNDDHHHGKCSMPPRIYYVASICM